MAKSRKKTKKKPSKKMPAKPKRAPARKKKPARAATARGGLHISVAPELEARLRMLATNMSKSLDQVLTQALLEFTETWEDHLRTVAALKDTEDRVQLSVPKE